MMSIRGNNAKSKRMQLAIVMVAYARIQNPNITDDDMRKVARDCLCDMCRNGVPREGNNHTIMGASIPCEAEKER